MTQLVMQPAWSVLRHGICLGCQMHEAQADAAGLRAAMMKHKRRLASFKLHRVHATIQTQEVHTHSLGSDTHPCHKIQTMLQTVRAAYADTNAATSCADA